ncbi:hypothetical protein GB927_012840 [Shinella sp. CPCC 100929]|uniref:Mu-like prophage FluMu N-terminal domain-containing protein n=1 Tax=Shinella lacus TaxID=2654216 RepID=A0ABT1R6Y5_9HYPH|nr:hypothetical protein [Shinella lacus]MCQ4630932.1 hypothetical protein [Shinella lacus]
MAKAPTSTNENENANAEGSEKREGRVLKLMSINGIRRAGIRFPAREAVPVDLADLTEEQVKLLENEPDLRPVR